MTKETILITGANGQIGLVLTEALRQKHGRDAVIATDINGVVTEERGPFEILDVLDANRMAELVQKYEVTQIYHLAAILSARGEQNPKWAWEVNIGSLFNVLETAKNFGLRVFYPSTIAVFGANTPKDLTPQETVTEPTTVYGISKAAGENWCQYYFEKYGVDVRSVRYPGIIGYQSLPGGGTTDYAVEIFHRAVHGENYTCFLAPETSLPMLYMDDAIRGTLDLMSAPLESLTVHTSYNLAGVSFSPLELVVAIQTHLPDFKVDYAPDFRQNIAESWPRSIDDSVARRDWVWHPHYDLKAMTADMIQQLQKKLAAV
jgi:nucleoside-diphosphate-sugar epimerase